MESYFQLFVLGFCVENNFLSIDDLGFMHLNRFLQQSPYKNIPTPGDILRNFANLTASLT